MEKKLQVFISSTFDDLLEERQKSVEAILNAGHIPAGMESFSAGDETQKKVIEKWISESDVYMLILGSRYGSIEQKSGFSYTEWEYHLAGELGIPRFALVLHDEYISKQIDEKKIDPLKIEVTLSKYKDFKKKVMSNLVAIIKNIDVIKGEVSASLRAIEKSNPHLRGWVRPEITENMKEELIKKMPDLPNVSDVYSSGPDSWPYASTKQNETKSILPDWPYANNKQNETKSILPTWPDDIEKNDGNSFSDSELFIFQTLYNRGGYILDFDTSKFNLFTLNSVDVAVQKKYGFSKGKSFELYLNEAPLSDQLKLLEDLGNYYKEYYLDRENEKDTYKKLYQKANTIIKRKQKTNIKNSNHRY